jgi:uroporphyrin-3 C-methyltransferase
LFQSDATGFKQSLHTAITWLEQYFVGDERDAMLANLKALQQTEINIAVPDISGSLVWLKEYQQ